VGEQTSDRSDGVVSRRSEYAEATRRAAIDAARRLFRKKGYFAVTVNEIAAQARVSPATVYAVNGGKQGLLRALIDEWSIAPEVSDTTECIESIDDPAEIVRYLTAMTRQMRQDYGDIMRVVIAAAPHDKTAAEGLALATRRYRAGDAVAARRLADLGALRDGIDADEALDILWFYLGYAGFFTLVDDNKWSFAKAEQWLCAAVSQALLEPHQYNAGLAARSAKMRATRGGLSAKRRPNRAE
jgi:AcrR family transcriptional regulator